MSKPLVFVLQLVALYLIVAGAASEPVGIGMIIWGVGLAVVSGIAIRRRFKSDRKTE